MKFGVTLKGKYPPLLLLSGYFSLTTLLSSLVMSLSKTLMVGSVQCFVQGDLFNGQMAWLLNVTDNPIKKSFIVKVSLFSCWRGSLFLLVSWKWLYMANWRTPPHFYYGAITVWKLFGYMSKLKVWLCPNKNRITITL